MGGAKFTTMGLFIEFICYNTLLSLKRNQATQAEELLFLAGSCVREIQVLETIQSIYHYEWLLTYNTNKCDCSFECVEINIYKAEEFQHILTRNEIEVSPDLFFN